MNVANITRFKLQYYSIIFVWSLMFLLASCASQTSSEQTATPNADAPSETTQGSTTSPSTPAAPEPSAVTTPEPQSGEAGSAAAQPEPAGTRLDMTALGQSCKKQPFVQYESQAREHIQHGWEATEAQRYGVGFRDRGEYEKWKRTHENLFAKVSNACGQLSDCLKQHTKDKDQACAAQAGRFEKLQTLAQQFADKAKIVELSQPSALCSLTPDPADPSQCYMSVAEQIEQTCQTKQCAETAGCFRGVSFLDDAINQAKLACGFVGQALSECRGYIEASLRRTDNIKQCVDMYNQLPMEIPPTI